MLKYLMAPYLFLYLIGYRINKDAWPPSFDADRAKAAALVSLVIGSFIVFSGAFIAGKLHYEIDKSKYTISIFTILICLLNDYILNKMKLGIKFEKKFDKLEIKQKRTIIIISVGSYVFLVCALFAMYLNFPRYK